MTVREILRINRTTPCTEKYIFIELSLTIVDMLLIMICMIPNVNLGVGEMGFLFCKLHVCLKQPLSWDINLTFLPTMISALQGDTSDSWNSCLSFSFLYGLFAET